MVCLKFALGFQYRHFPLGKQFLRNTDKEATVLKKGFSAGKEPLKSKGLNSNSFLKAGKPKAI